MPQLFCSTLPLRKREIVRSLHLRSCALLFVAIVHLSFSSLGSPDAILCCGMIADVHSHVISESLLARFARNRDFGFEDAGDGIYTAPGYGPLDWGLYRHEERLQGLVDRKVELQVISPLPYFLNWPGGAADVEFARLINGSTAECVAGSNGRFAGLAVLPLSEPDKAIAELDRTLGEHGFVGVALVGHRCPGRRD